MSRDRSIETHAATWRGIELEIRYEPVWLDLKHSVAHLEVCTTRPDHEPLPITETGYRSHFTARENIDALGGPVAYVLGWLDTEAKSPIWKKAETARRQLSLF